MDSSNPTIAQQVAKAAIASQRQRTARTPSAVTVTFGDNTLVVMLHGALSPAEQMLARSPAGAAQVQEFQRQLFASTLGVLGQEIRRITGVDIVEAGQEVQTGHGAVVHAFTGGTVVQVFLLAHRMPVSTWSELVRGGPTPLQNGDLVPIIP